jgi:hypothetical protein
MEFNNIIIINRTTKHLKNERVAIGLGVKIGN